MVPYRSADPATRRGPATYATGAGKFIGAP